MRVLKAVIWNNMYLNIHYNPRQGLLTMRIDTPAHTHTHAQTHLRKGLVRDKQNLLNTETNAQQK